MAQLFKRINKLTKSVADKIAAGEVVDRPLSVVKEMVENSIDSGASSITIEIKNAGKSYIRVTDNGSGIMGEDLDMAFQRHSTSKLVSAEDLDSIMTLGFRGEALSSISAVSRIEVITKSRDETLGNRMVLEAGEVIERGATGCPDGTTIVVTDLFFNTPARLKFMKKDSQESSLIIDFVSKMALAYPNIKIRLINNKVTLFFTPGSGDIYTNILMVYGKDIGEKLIHVRNEEGDLSLEAYISPPDQSKSTRKNQVFFVNGRNISSKLLETAVSEAYREKLFEGRHPIAFLFLLDNPHRMDVNIHPNKREIRFDDELRIKKFVSESLRPGLLTKDSLKNIKPQNPFRNDPLEDLRTTRPDPNKSKEQVDITSLLSTMREEGHGLEHPLLGKDPMTRLLNDQISDRVKDETSSYNPQEFSPGELTITGSIFNTYLTAMDETCFYLIDQHAAHERVFYEQFLNLEQGQEKKSQQMILTPFLIEVLHEMATMSDDWLPIVEKMGYEIEEFGPRSYIIKAIPVFTTLAEARAFLDYFMENLSEIQDIKDPRQIDKLIMSACKNAVKAGDPLNLQEMEHLMKDLGQTENPFSCPHGRPVFLRLSKLEIERMFKRK